MQETKTIAKITEELNGMGISCYEVKDGGVIGVVDGAHPGKTLLLRADIDALPMQESETNLEFVRDCRSSVDGVMHACGHDGHAAILLVVAKILQENKSELYGRFLLVFERAEETFGGITALIKEIDSNYHVDGNWGLHLQADIDTGKASVDAGPRMAGPFSFEYIIHGRGGHGSRPDKCISPIDVFVDIYQAVQNLKASHSDPYSPVTFNIGKVHTGTVANIIPGDLTFSGGFRILDYERVGAFYIKSFHRIVKSACERYGATYTRVRYSPRDMVVYNNPVASAIAKESVLKVLGEDGLLVREAVMGSECYAMYQKRSPGVFAFVGTRNLQKGVGADHHNTSFDLDYDALEHGVALTLQYALDFQAFKGDFDFKPDSAPIEDLMMAKKYLDMVED